MAEADYRVMTETTGKRIAEALEDVTAMVGPPGEVSEAELTAKLADKADVIVDTASGAIASFPDGMAAPANDITIAIEPVQSGSGDPSPTNVRPISGRTGANVVVSPTTDAQDGTTYPISWQSEAGTVYGGTLDVTTGLLTVDRAKIIAADDGSWRYSVAGGQYSYVFKNNMIIANDLSRFLCNIAPIVYTSSDLGITRSGAGYIQIYCSSLGISSLDAWKSYIANNQVEFCYPLSTPVTYTLTTQAIALLLGVNNVWADTGDTTVTYRADTKLYTQKINAPTDDDMIADAQIASGKYFIVGGNLYRSTTTIPAGDAITPGTNCILTNLADALNALNT